MIKVGISGADSPMAGELIRILVNHPDVVITSLYAPVRKNMDVSAVHHGLIGESSLKFSDSLDIDNTDFLFLLGSEFPVDSLPEDMKWVDLSDNRLLGLRYGTPDTTIFGLSEAFRKPLVRGAIHAVIPNPVASAAIIALNPLVLESLVQGDVRLDIQMPARMITELGEPFLVNAIEEIKRALSKIQPDFNQKVSVVSVSESTSARSMNVAVSFQSNMDISTTASYFDAVYDDHNFTFLTHMDVDPREVEGTNKCVLRLSRPDFSTLRIDALIDPTMRGGASEAVHVMNLLCGLYEKTGLALKSVSL
ncbi:MAG: hypothetical protein NC186_01485 [Prevotella sp.]|nr:hypothetical protein [Prevotella sp.]